jgi:hypothetical protein
MVVDGQANDGPPLHRDIPKLEGKEVATEDIPSITTEFDV